MRERILERLAAHRPVRVRASPRAAARGATARGATALTPAGVLVPLIEREAGLTLLLTQRTIHLPEHSGEVCFPGGRHEPGDRDLIETALRESEEEIGLDRRLVEVAGCLDVYHTGTGFAVVPVVGFIRAPFALAPDPVEVEAVFEVPLDFLLDPINRRRERRRYPEGEFEYHVYDFGGRRIWGATAGMIVNFLELIGTD